MRANAALIQDVHLKVQSVLVSVSREFVDDMGQNAPDSSFPGDQFARSSRKCSNYHLYELYVERELKLATADERHRRHEHFRDVGSVVATGVPLKRPHTAGTTTRRASGLSNEIGRVRWTMAAIQRRKCAQLARFAQLVVFLELDAFEAVVRRNGEMVYQSLLRGANAAVIRRLTDPSAYELALRAMARESQRELASIADEAAAKASNADALTLTKQQLKRLLRSIWESAFHASAQSNTARETRESTTRVLDASNEIWDQSKFEAAFCQALAMYKGEANSTTVSDAFSAEEIPCIARMMISDALVLQPFHSDTNDLFSKEEAGTPITPSTEMGIDEGADPDPLSSEIDEDGFFGRLRAIGSIAPMPLFSLQLELGEANPGGCEICISPSLDDVVMTVQDVLGSFLDLFKALPSLVSHPILRAVLDFAEDLLASTLVVNDGRSIDPAATQQGPSFITTGADRAAFVGTADEADDTNTLSTFSRLEERMQSDRRYQSTCSGVAELISSTVEAMTALANRYLAFLELHVQNQAVNFDEKARRFRSGLYQLRNISDDILDYQEQVC